MPTPYLTPDESIPAWVRAPRPPANLIGTSTAARKLRRRWWMVYIYPDRRCSYCAEPLERTTLDHVIPDSAGGLRTIDNLVPACASCNVLKDNMPLLMFLWRRAGWCN